MKFTVNWYRVALCFTLYSIVYVCSLIFVKLDNIMMLALYVHTHNEACEMHTYKVMYGKYLWVNRVVLFSACK